MQESKPNIHDVISKKITLVTSCHLNTNDIQQPKESGMKTVIFFGKDVKITNITNVDKL